jgi:hypothetical protein
MTIRRAQRVSSIAAHAKRLSIFDGLTEMQLHSTATHSFQPVDSKTSLSMEAVRFDHLIVTFGARALLRDDPSENRRKKRSIKGRPT